MTNVKYYLGHGHPIVNIIYDRYKQQNYFGKKRFIAAEQMNMQSLVIFYRKFIALQKNGDQIIIVPNIIFEQIEKRRKNCGLETVALFQ